MKKIKFLTAGESHGKGLLGILQGIPSNLLISEEYEKCYYRFNERLSTKQISL